MPRLNRTAMAADDQLIDSLAVLDTPTGRNTTPEQQSDLLVGLLSAWRDDINSTPIPGQPDTSTAMLALRPVRVGRGPIGWVWLALLVAVMVVLLLVLTGCGLATPGSSRGCATARPDVCPGSPQFARAITVPVSSGGPLLVIGANDHVSGTYPAHCVSVKYHPDRTCTPGSIRSDITQDNIDQNICNPHWSTRSIRAPQAETDRVKTLAMRAYGLAPSQRATTELDHDVMLDLGGSNDVTNLWSELSDLPGQGFRNSKDNVELKLHAAVCNPDRARRVPLRDAQIALVTDWTTALVVLHIAA